MEEEDNKVISVEKQVPVGIKIISILYYIGAIIGIILAGIFFFMHITTIGSQAVGTSFLGGLGVGFIIGGIIMISLSVLGFFIGRGLWKAKPWARIVAIIFTGLGILIAVISMITVGILANIISLVTNLAIGGYLLFNKKVKEAFA